MNNRHNSILLFGLLWLFSAMAPCQTTKNWQMVIDKLSFPEGPAWDGQVLYASNCRGNWITRVAVDTQHVFLQASSNPFTFAKTNGMTAYRDGSLFACDFGIGAIIRIRAKTGEIIVPGYKGEKFHRPNDLAFDRRGYLYFTDPNAYDRTKPDGVVYRIDIKTREVKPVATDLAFPNGIAFAADGKTVMIGESAFNRILQFSVQKDGSLSNRRVFAELPGGDPDGMAFDRQGRLYVAHFGSGTVYVLNPDGSIHEVIAAPGKKPSNVEFGGADLTTLFLTETETNAIYKNKVTTPGLPLFCSPGSK
jgi:gluconolactonase